MSATTLCEQRVFGVQLHSRHVAVLVLAVHADTHIACGDTFDAAVLVIEDFRRREAGIDFYAQAFSLFGQPAAYIAHRDNVVAFVVRGLGDHEVGQFDGAGLAEVEEELVTLDRSAQWRAHLFPGGEEFVHCAWLEYRP